MFGKVLTKVFGSKQERDVKKVLPTVERINSICEGLRKLSDGELSGKTEEFKGRLAQRENLDDLLPEAFAVVKETCRRLVGKRWEVSGIEIEWDMVPFDVQLVGAVILHQGKIAEMATGEGKTLVATMPIYLNALTGKGVHLVTVNDYLARRDAQWMGKIYESLGLTVGCIQNQMDPEQRKEQYNCDITYGTNNEFGFDYLRDNMAIRLEDRVQRGHYYAIVDEVDSVLIDEARTPLIISGPVSVSTHRYDELHPQVKGMVRKQTVLVNRLVAEGEELLKEGKDYEAGIEILTASRGAPKNKRLMKLLKEQGVKKLIGKVENDYLRDKRMGEIDEQLYYSIDERENSINLMEQGIQLLTPQQRELFVLPDLSVEIHRIDSDDSLSPTDKSRLKDKVYREYAERSEKIHNINQLLKAHSLFEKDVDYVVQDGKVMIVDEFTGRLLPGRRYSDGLHQALEAKEGVRIERETQTLATITLQNYFRLYDKLAGMTGTAETEANEFWEIYKLDVAVIPTNEPVRRIDYDDVIFRTKREKYNAIIKEVARLHQKGHPVLVGTVSVDVSETLSRMLRHQGIPHAVLNAKHHQREAEIVALAGQKGAVTIATNMAGRGTDIKLGPGVVKHPGCRVVALPEEGEVCPYYDELRCEEDVPCGLRIIGTERHEARRIDRQLRGRSGRQGDPGSSRFYLSLDDDLMRLFGSERIAAVMDKLGVKEGEVIRHPMVTRAIQRAQKRVEAQNFSIRKHLLEYDDVMNRQREVIYDRRLHALEGENLRQDIVEMIAEWIENKISSYVDPKLYPEEWDLEGLNEELRRLFLVEVEFGEVERKKGKDLGLKELVKNAVLATYKSREAELGEEQLRELERLATLQVIDERWKEHLYELDQLKEGIGLRAYGQKDPLVEYKREAFDMFLGLLDQINQEVLEVIFKAQIRPLIAPILQPEEMRELHSQAQGVVSSTPTPHTPPTGKPAPLRVKKKIGRNDPCPCGSGKKYKNCCGRFV